MLLVIALIQLAASIMAAGFVYLSYTGRIRHTPGYMFEDSLRRLEVAGYGSSRIERIFHLKNGFCDRVARHGSWNPANIALFRLLSTRPALVEVASDGYRNSAYDMCIIECGMPSPYTGIRYRKDVLLAQIAHLTHVHGGMIPLEFGNSNSSEYPISELKLSRVCGYIEPYFRDNVLYGIVCVNEDWPCGKMAAGLISELGIDKFRVGFSVVTSRNSTETGADFQVCNFYLHTV